MGLRDRPVYRHLRGPDRAGRVSVGHMRDEQVIQGEDDPDSSVSRGRPCPKGSATLQLDLDTAMNELLTSLGGVRIENGQRDG